MIEGVGAAVPYSLSEIARRTGGKPRSIQLWADGGVIQGAPETDRAGSGTHRMFDEQELQIAALLVPLARMGVPIGVLRAFSQVFRNALLLGKVQELSPNHPLARDTSLSMTRLVLDRAARGDGQNYLLFAFSREKLWIDVTTDAVGPVSIDPQRTFPEASKDPRIVMGILNLEVLHGLLN